jgi:hypothetical protein
VALRGHGAECGTHPTPEQAADEAADRAAIEAEVNLPPGARPDSECARWLGLTPDAHAAWLRMLRVVAMRRPSSWPDINAAPAGGCWCSTCRGSQWCRDDATGWCCAICHPADLAKVAS